MRSIGHRTQRRASQDPGMDTVADDEREVRSTACQLLHGERPVHYGLSTVDEDTPERLLIGDHRR